MRKDRVNREKHGVSFQHAQYAFADPDRVIAADLSHSKNEKFITALERPGLAS